MSKTVYRGGRAEATFMGSQRFQAVLFSAFSNDHSPPHIHAEYAEMGAILDLIPGGGIQLSTRKDAIEPPNAKKSDVRRVLRVARMYEQQLRNLWGEMHGADTQ